MKKQRTDYSTLKYMKRRHSTIPEHYELTGHSRIVHVLKMKIA